MLVTEGILLVLVTLLLVVVIYQGGGLGKGALLPVPGKTCAEGFAGGAPPDSLALGPHLPPEAPLSGEEIPLTSPPWVAGETAPISPFPPPPVGAEGYGLDSGYGAADLAKNFRNWAASPRDIEEAQRAAWFEATAKEDPPPFYTNQGGIVAPSPALNYQDTLVDLIADPRMRAQQANWYSEVAPKSQTSMKVDTIDEAAAVSAFRGWGIYSFRFGAPAQHNPLFITSEGPEDFALEATEFRVGG
jgi:hypothetical protein